MKKLIIVVVVLVILASTANTPMGYQRGYTASDYMTMHYNTKMEYKKVGLHYKPIYFLK